MQTRTEQLNNWIKTIVPQNEEYQIATLAGDASFRRYFRLSSPSYQAVIMDAPPEKEPTEAFIRVGKLLAQNDVKTPKILATDQSQGFLLLEDFGDELLLNCLNDETVDFYYTEALKALLQIQTCPVSNEIPAFDIPYMKTETHLFKEWFLNRLLSITLSPEEEQLLEKTIDDLLDEINQQPKVFIHRDYHSRNLLVTDNGLGIIDFQDAMTGPVSYDLVSLVKDCYVQWPREKVLRWIEWFWQNSPLLQHYQLDEFIRAVDLCGLQRHLKVAGIFSRLYLRDNKSAYLENLPLTLQYIRECAAIYEPLQPFLNLLNQRVNI